jgi:hypothetical protein
LDLEIVYRLHSFNYFANADETGTTQLDPNAITGR